MSVGTKLLQAAAGGGSDPVYVDDVFSTTLYTGTDSSVVVPTGLDLADKGGLIWGKSRSGSQNHRWYDSARGTQYSLISNATSAQSDQGTQTFGSNSVTLGAASGLVGSSSYGGPDYVLWSFAKQEKFFDMVTYTGDGSNNRTIAHNLNTTPGMVIVKRTDSSSDWYVWHRNGGDYASLAGAYAYLNDTDQFRTGGGTPVFYDAGMTSTTFGIGNSGGTNGSSNSYIAYLFGHNDAEYGENSDEALIYCGKYTGTGSAGLNVALGFEPQWVMIKRANASDDWVMYDVMRGMPVGGDSAELNPNASTAENGYFGSSQPDINPYASGFTLQGTSSPYNNSASTYIYMAIRRSHKPASEFAANKLFSMDGAGNASGDPDFVSNGHIVDWAFLKLIAGSEGAYATARLTGSTYISLSSADKEYSDGTLDKDFQSGFGDSASSAVANYQAWMFRRAKGFFDVVVYKTTPSSYAQTDVVTHNLGAIPELIIVKNRDGSGNIWMTYNSVSGVNKYLQIESNNAIATGTWSFPSAPTATQFTTGYAYPSGTSAIALLFATVAGISKVGSYTGTGSDLNVDCGFSAGARFILIKRTDSTGDWYVYDSVRGIVAGDDPYFLLNSTAAQVTNTDYIDPLSSGFTVTSSAPAGLNASSGTYIFLAIA